MQRAAKAGACILPADSEHNALFQALGSGNREELVRVIITTSGGPFRTWASVLIRVAGDRLGLPVPGGNDRRVNSPRA